MSFKYSGFNCSQHEGLGPADLPGNREEGQEEEKLLFGIFVYVCV